MANYRKKIHVSPIKIKKDSYPKYVTISCKSKKNTNEKMGKRFIRNS